MAADRGGNYVLARGGTLVLDGGTGSELRRRGMPLDAASGARSRR